MIRKTLTILSLVGLVVSVMLWGLSYYGLRYGPLGSSDWAFRNGAVVYNEYLASVTAQLSFRSEHQHYDPYTSRWSRVGWFFQESPRSHTIWKPHWRQRAPGEHYWILPLWLPTSVFTLSTFCFLVPYNRRHRRRKLGLCVKCEDDVAGASLLP